MTLQHPADRGGAGRGRFERFAAAPLEAQEGEPGEAHENLRDVIRMEEEI
ncbi:hypothetical protein [Streptomyces sp. NPDC097610]